MNNCAWSLLSEAKTTALLLLTFYVSLFAPVIVLERVLSDHLCAKISILFRCFRWTRMIGPDAGMLGSETACGGDFEGPEQLHLVIKPLLRVRTAIICPTESGSKLANTQIPQF